MTLNAALIEALERSPASIRALSREAGLPHSSLVRARQGLIRVTPTVARAVAEALEGWSGRCAEGANRIRTALGVQDHES